MYVISTRNPDEKLLATEAVLKGIAENGGLFVPESFPEIDMKEAQKIAKSGYSALSAFVMGKIFDIPKNEMEELTKKAYASFNATDTIPFSEVCLGGDFAGKESLMELYHGPTLAFKDVALQVLPRLMSYALKEHGQKDKILVLTATSGDTGKAALEGFSDVESTAILVFYPQEGVSKLQKLQMITQEGKNTGVCAVKGNFDDAQTGVKMLFADEEFNKLMKEKGYSLSSANSINIGRLIPQVVYYVYAYIKAVEEGNIKDGEKINFCVPTGNFGNILAAYYAMQMGIPINKLICASNKNNVLTDFFKTGEYNAKREFYKTMSPSMDILISSNLERLLFELADRDGNVVSDMMQALSNEGIYKISGGMKEQLDKLFFAECCDEEETKKTIKELFSKTGLLIDTHTAVAQCVYEKYVEQTNDSTFTVVASTADPYKFTQDVLFAMTEKTEQDAFVAANMLSEESKTKIPPQISELETKEVLHKGVVEKEKLDCAVVRFLEEV